jgi:hypothetical protein
MLCNIQGWVIQDVVTVCLSVTDFTYHADLCVCRSLCTQLTWNVAISACIGDLNGDSGYIYTPARSLNLSSFYCEWKRNSAAAMNKTIALTLLNGTISGVGYHNCVYRWNALRFTTGESSKTNFFLAVICNAGRWVRWNTFESNIWGFCFGSILNCGQQSLQALV